jgi:hypothetical protein
MSRSDPARLSAADVLAAVGELDCARAARAYATLGYPVVPMHTPALAAPAPAPIPPAARQASTRGWPAGPDWPPTHPAVVGEWWRPWPNANLGLATGRRFDVLDLDGEWGGGGAARRRPGRAVGTPGAGGAQRLRRLAPAVRPHRAGQPRRAAAGGGLAGPRWAGRGATLPACQRPPVRLGPAPDGRATRGAGGLQRLLAPPLATRTTLPQRPNPAAGMAAGPGGTPRRRWPGRPPGCAPPRRGPATTR